MDAVDATGGYFFIGGFDIFGFGFVVHESKNKNDIMPFIHDWAVLLDHADFFFFAGIKKIQKHADTCRNPEPICFHGEVRSMTCAVHPSGSGPS